MRRGLWLLLVLVLPGLAVGQSLGDAARKEAERRKKNKEAGLKAPSFTDEGQDRKEPTAPGATPRPAPSADAPPAAPAASDDSAARDAKEQYWRGRWATARQRRDEAKERYDKVNELWLAPGESYVDSQGRVVIRDLQELRSLVAQAKAAWDAAEKALVDLEDEGRRAGALPGWFR
jgi:hypothetical protein